mmetsp:Transcript_12596/g.23970  ORF Transcript_12596/g.23970 Transcript_12596/m.23970 type:complete len:409 (-) Transcript_12596:17-1243(-)
MDHSDHSHALEQPPPPPQQQQQQHQARVYFNLKRVVGFLVLAVFGLVGCTVVTEGSVTAALTQNNGTMIRIRRYSLQSSTHSDDINSNNSRNSSNNDNNTAVLPMLAAASAVASNATTTTTTTTTSTPSSDDTETNSMYSFQSIVSIAATTFIATNMDNLTLLVGILVQYHASRLVWVIGGYYVAMSTLCLVAFCIGEAADTMPVEYLGLLGCIPFCLGLYGFYQLYYSQQQQNDNTEDDEDPEKPNSVQEKPALLPLPPTQTATSSSSPSSSSSSTSSIAPTTTASPLTVFTTTFATQVGNGSDTIVTFGILFADIDSNGAGPAATTTTTTTIIAQQQQQHYDGAWLVFATVVCMSSIFVMGAVWGIRHPIVTQFADDYGPKLTPLLMIVLGTMLLWNTRSSLLSET